jgi:hypothetical protein
MPNLEKYWGLLTEEKFCGTAIEKKSRKIVYGRIAMRPYTIFRDFFSTLLTCLICEPKRNCVLIDILFNSHSAQSPSAPPR